MTENDEMVDNFVIRWYRSCMKQMREMVWWSKHLETG